MTVCQIAALFVTPLFMLALGCFLPVPDILAAAWFKRRAPEVHRYGGRGGGGSGSACAGSSSANQAIPNLAHPPATSRRKPDWVRDEVLRLYALLPRTGCRKLAHNFNRLYAACQDMTVGKTWVAGLLRDFERERAAYIAECNHRIPNPLPRNRCWGMDLTGKSDAAGNIHNILGLIDHGSRVALALHPMADKRAITLVRALCDAVDAFGMPRILRTDNEAVWKSWLFQLSLRLLGIRHQFTKLHCPWQNGRVERLFGTLKDKLDHLVVSDFAGLNQAMIEFRFWYNAVRPHQHLQGRTPAEAWCGIDPYQHPPRDITYVSAWGGLLTGFWLRR